MRYQERLQAFYARLNPNADLAFLPIGSDLQYLTGIPRDLPTYGATLHPGQWLEGGWFVPGQTPIIVLPRMTAEYGGLSIDDALRLRILGDHESPIVLAKTILRDACLPLKTRIAVSDRAHAETLIQLQALLPHAAFISASDLLRPLRQIKDADEITLMQRAGAITEAAFEAVLRQLKQGMTELDVIAEVDYQLRQHGALGPSFTTSLYNSGPNTPLLFGQRERSWRRTIEPPVAVLFDFGAAVEGMCYDYGRTVAFGAPSAEFERIYQTVMEAQQAGIQALRAGAHSAETVDQAAREVIEAAGYGAMFRHRLGHAIGLDVHEPPFLTAGDDTPIASGMLFTIEPSIMQPHDFSARVEDVVVAAPGGGQPLTQGFQSLFVVE
ncbi:MAG: M24 family metallopeptidase [Aggregatilineales bacterium]